MSTEQLRADVMALPVRAAQTKTGSKTMYLIDRADVLAALSRAPAADGAGELPPLPPHPERYMVWTDLEKQAIQDYARAALTALQPAQSVAGAQPVDLSEAQRQNLELMIVRIETISAGNSDDPRTLAAEALVCARALLNAQPSRSAMPCGVNEFSSRMCERGTKGCHISHGDTEYQPSQPAPVPLIPMGEEGNEWYFDCDDHYIDVKRDEDGKYSVYFRNRKDGSEGWHDQADEPAPVSAEPTWDTDPAATAVKVITEGMKRWPAPPLQGNMAAPVSADAVRGDDYQLAQALNSLRWLLNKTDPCDTPNMRASTALDKCHSKDGKTVRQDLEYLWSYFKPHRAEQDATLLAGPAAHPPADAAPVEAKSDSEIALEMRLAAYKALHEQARNALNRWHQQAKALGFDGVSDALAALATPPRADAQAKRPMPPRDQALCNDGNEPKWSEYEQAEINAALDRADAQDAARCDGASAVDADQLNADFDRYFGSVGDNATPAQLMTASFCREAYIAGRMHRPAAVQGDALGQQAGATQEMLTAFENAVPKFTRDQVDHPNDTGRINWRSLEDDAVLRSCLSAALAQRPTSAAPYAYDIRDKNGDGCLRLAKDIDPRRLIAVKVTPLYTETRIEVKDHVLREVVNNLRDTAIKFHGTQQLRERLRGCLEPLLSVQPTSAADSEDAARLSFMDQNLKFGMGWRVGHATAGNVVVQSIIGVNTTIREAIDNARNKKGGAA